MILDLPNAKKSCIFVGSSNDDLREMPEDAKRVLTYGILMAEYGEKHPDAKPLKGFDGASVLEIVADDRGDTFRAVYTVQFEGFIYVLHAFQKKSKKGAKTPKPDMDLIKKRLQAAKKDYEARIKKAS